jgi:protein-L-isoaspartate(D-aspartate) O-methyltransferase
MLRLQHRYLFGALPSSFSLVFRPLVAVLVLACLAVFVVLAHLLASEKHQHQHQHQQQNKISQKTPFSNPQEEKQLQQNENQKEPMEFLMRSAGSRSTNADLVRLLKLEGNFRSDIVEQTMLAVDRKWFVHPQRELYSYVDAPQPMGHGVTISAPHMHANMLESLVGHLKPGGRALDIGFGSGILMAYLAEMVGTDHGKVIGIEYLQPVFEFGRNNLKAVPKYAKMIEDGKMVLLNQDGHNGYPEMAPYDAIHVGAAASEVPQALVDQLANGGRMVIPVGPQGGTQHVIIVDKDHLGRVSERKSVGVMFVPLVKGEKK